MKIKIGSENLLEALNFKNAKQAKGQRMKVEDELKSSSRKIAKLKLDLEKEIQRSEQPSPPNSGRLSQLFQSARKQTPLDEQATVQEETADESESPTFMLAEILQHLEAQGLPTDYYVEHANNLIELLKKYQTLKYDLVWSIFGLRVSRHQLSAGLELCCSGYQLYLSDQIPRVHTLHYCGISNRESNQSDPDPLEEDELRVSEMSKAPHCQSTSTI